ncbi:MBL fold metallo-hydrolase [Actinoalloteichus caeruleus]|uniref:Glyoxylase, beta-lactamase superfamily II n=1 Tax=Actinoalloteichus caeruleus DSM 43889 TaxID=1120930 RepID=A0ABT1JC71_ACTCY|nr:MBL fold metallo-hydrolase [Actinoalloteichus caeruleus]MCP2329819.1 Glyoxylase, beta-lactamase superfamily II [Actinoalloteichus caeruleus DSM 43889]
MEGPGNPAKVRALTDQVHAYLPPDGGWGWANSGLVRGAEASLLVDTSFDARLTHAMLDALRPLTEEAPLRLAVNTHGDGDHWYGNHVLPSSVDIVATSAAATEMRGLTPDVLANLVQAELPRPTRDYVRRAFGAFAFADTGVRLPTDTFTGRLSLDLGGTTVDLLEVGPAHTSGDLLVHVPASDTVFTGDILFVGVTPIMWDGPIDNWIAALDRVLGLQPKHIVPGHGPLTDAAGVVAVRSYLEHVRRETRERFDHGMPPEEAAADIDLGEFAHWLLPERVVVTVDRLYHEFDPDRPLTGKIAMFDAMARYDASRFRRATGTAADGSTGGSGPSGTVAVRPRDGRP